MLVNPSRTELPFAALLTYSPRGRSAVSRASQDIVLDLKGNRVIDTRRGAMSASRYVAVRLAEELLRGPFPRWFNDAVLVPMPRSAPLKKGALWPAFQIATEMFGRGIGRVVVPCLERAVAVPKSAFCAPGDRPTPSRHAESLVTSGTLPLGAGRVVLVDDVVTRGASLLGAAVRLRGSFAQVEIAAFAAVRTMSWVPEIDAILAPCTGTIRLDGDLLLREP